MEKSGPGMENVASKLNAEWGATRALFIGEFYDNAGVQSHMERRFDVSDGESDGWHDTFWLTAMQASVAPETVRYEQRVAAGHATINGVSIVPLGRTIAIGEELLRWRVESTVRVINQKKRDAR